MLLVPEQRTLSIDFEIVLTSASGNASANRVLRQGLPRFRGTPSRSGVRSPSPSGARSSLGCRIIIPTPLRAACQRLATRFVTIQSFPWTIGLAMPMRGVVEGRRVTTVTVPGVRRLVIRVMTECGVLPIAAGRRGSCGRVLISLGSCKDDDPTPFKRQYLVVFVYVCFTLLLTSYCQIYAITAYLPV